ncbi:hypothetical protein GIB67_039895 [Kingdonia uniflora]|uniref:DYW domain-containing protein n=1 Tax=Kingdonia uniflora TaxID=39325 RepID=A0A7J7P480_9MAGN|nr:hypothetical protein GIB67_039895 [Kingdonia uniflora]
MEDCSRMKNPERNWMSVSQFLITWWLAVGIEYPCLVLCLCRWSVFRRPHLSDRLELAAFVEASSRDREWLRFKFKDDCDSMKVGLREFDSSWTWQANELRATDILVGLSGGDALGLSSRAAFHTVPGEKALCSRMQRISKGAMLECTAHTFFRRFETKRQYPDEKADSSRMKVRSLRTSVGMGEVKDYPDVALASVGCMPLARRACEDGWYTPTARPCTPHDPLFHCTPGTVEAVPGWAVTNASDVIQTLERLGLKMCHAHSWIEIKKQTHFFLSGDKSHAQTQKIYQKLHELVQEISKHGYVPAYKFVLPDVDNQEEHISSYHSEKLAVAFGLISTSESTSLQVLQSHQICTDCHKMIKLVSMVARQDIVVRDSNRFHHFKNGACSCRDYW